MALPTQNSAELLRRLLDAEVDLVLVGGMAAIAWGSQQLTKDLDVAAPLTLENVKRIMGVVRPLEPRFYQTLGKPPVTRDDDDLATFKNLYFQTTLGIVDVLTAVPPVGDFAEVARRADRLEVYGRSCRVIAIDDLIAVKALVGRPKDRVVEAELRAIRERLKNP
jgi:predicted nucleotidyltransferase